MVTCPVCGLRMKRPGRSHLVSHGLTGSGFHALRIEKEFNKSASDFLQDVYVAQGLAAHIIRVRYKIPYYSLRDLLNASGIPVRNRSQAVINGQKKYGVTLGAKPGSRNIAKREDVRKKISLAKLKSNPGLMPMLLASREQRIANPTAIESVMMNALSQAGIAFEREHQVGRYCIDFALIDIKVAVECDGKGWHERNATGDLKRDGWLKEHGWLIFRYTSERISADASQCVQDLISRLHELGIDPPTTK